MSGECFGACLLSNYSKCSTHLFLCCSSPMICLIFHQSFSVSVLPGHLIGWSFKTLMFPTFAACSSASANPSMYFLLSALMLFSTLLLAFEYSSCALDFSALVLLELTAAYLSFISLIRLSVSAEIHSLWWGFLGPKISSQSETNDSFPSAIISLIIFHQFQYIYQTLIDLPSVLRVRCCLLVSLVPA